MMPKALNSIIIPIFPYYQYCITIIDSYCSKLKYKTKQFTKSIYYNHKQVVD